MGAGSGADMASKTEANSLFLLVCLMRWTGFIHHPNTEDANLLYRQFRSEALSTAADDDC
jgi:hypothetical protein